MDMPRNSERPVIKRFLMEFMFVNCRKDKPTDPAAQEHDLHLLNNIREKIKCFRLIMPTYKTK